MQQFDVWESPQQEVFLLFSELREQAYIPWTTCTSTVDTSPNAAVSGLLRSRPRIRRRRRKRAWSIPCIYLLPMFLVHGILQVLGCSA